MEIDFNKPLVPCVRLMGRIQCVEYEGLHIICFQCRPYGHCTDDCFQLKPMTAGDDPMVSNTIVSDPPPPLIVSNQQPLGSVVGFDPWIFSRPFRHRRLPLMVRQKGISNKSTCSEKVHVGVSGMPTSMPPISPNLQAVENRSVHGGV